MLTRQTWKAISWEILQWSMRKLKYTLFNLITTMLISTKNCSNFQKLRSSRCLSIQSAGGAAAKCKNACRSIEIWCSSFAGWKWMLHLSFFYPCWGMNCNVYFLIQWNPFQSALQSWQQKKERRDREKNEREQLLSRRFTSNSETSIDIDYSLQHNNSMLNAHRGVDDMLMTGSSALDNLKAQRDKLKGAHKRILDIGNTLGLSNHTMRVIEKRISEDKYVLYVGMGVTLLIIFIFIYYFVF